MRRGGVVVWWAAARGVQTGVRSALALALVLVFFSCRVLVFLLTVVRSLAPLSFILTLTSRQ